MQARSFAAALCCAIVGASLGERSAVAASSDPQLERGRYVALVAGCNDCHTAGFPQSGGTVPESEWFKGDRLGWRGPWGTTFAPNLRIYMQKLSEDAWVKTARTLKTRPPMPWWALHAMNEADLRALYRFIRGLGEPGSQAPAYLPPEKKPSPPYIELVLPPDKPVK